MTVLGMLWLPDDLVAASALGCVAGFFWAGPTLRALGRGIWSKASVDGRGLHLAREGGTLQIPLEAISAIEVWPGRRKASLLRVHHGAPGRLRVDEVGVVDPEEAAAFCYRVGQAAEPRETVRFAADFSTAWRTGVVACVMLVPIAFLGGIAHLVFVVATAANAALWVVISSARHAGMAFPLANFPHSAGAWARGQRTPRRVRAYRDPPPRSD